MVDGRVEQPRLAELLVVVVARFGQAVGEEDEPIAGAERDVRLFVLGVGDHAQHRAACAEPLDRSVGAHEHRQVVPGVAVGEHARWSRRARSRRS